MNAKSQPSISVIIAVYNGAATLARAIESVLLQTYQAHEIIVVDDGSTDNIVEIVSRFGNSVRYFCQPNQGVSVARNKGADLAGGEWLAFLDRRIGVNRFSQGPGRVLAAAMADPNPGLDLSISECNDLIQHVRCWITDHRLADQPSDPAGDGG